MKHRARRTHGFIFGGFFAATALSGDKGSWGKNGALLDFLPNECSRLIDGKKNGMG